MIGWFSCNVPSVCQYCPQNFALCLYSFDPCLLHLYVASHFPAEPTGVLAHAASVAKIDLTTAGKGPAATTAAQGELGVQKSSRFCSQLCLTPFVGYRPVRTYAFGKTLRG